MDLTRTAPLSRALCAQLLGLLTAGIAMVLAFPEPGAHPFFLACIQGVGAALASWLLRGPVWWLPIHLGFFPLAVLAQRMDVSPWLWLAGFVVLLLVFWRTDQSRVPLYLTNAPTSKALAAQMPDLACSVIDLGCGDGGLIRRLASLRPDCHFVGYEHAPLTWAWAWLLSHGQPNIDIRLGDFWRHSLADYDMVYAFLSPAPMAKLWAKAQIEMKASARLVSNSFAVPEARPEQTIQVPDGRKTLLFRYQPATRAADGKKHQDCPAA